MFQSRFRLAGKRAFDATAASLALVAVLPVLGAAALAILVTEGRPIFFVQTRAGRNGHPFRIIKFRTMRYMASRR